MQAAQARIVSAAEAVRLLTAQLVRVERVQLAEAAEAEATFFGEVGAFASASKADERAASSTLRLAGGGAAASGSAGAVVRTSGIAGASAIGGAEIVATGSARGPAGTSGATAVSGAVAASGLSAAGARDTAAAVVGLFAGTGARTLSGAGSACFTRARTDASISSVLGAAAGAGRGTAGMFTVDGTSAGSRFGGCAGA